MIYELAAAVDAADVGKQKRIFLLNPASRSWLLPTVVASIVVLNDLHNLKIKKKKIMVFCGIELNCGFQNERHSITDIVMNSDVSYRVS